VAMSLVPSPSFSKVWIKMCCAAFSCGTIIVDTKKLTRKADSGGIGKRGRRIDEAKWWVNTNSALRSASSSILEDKLGRVHSHAIRLLLYLR